MTDAERRLWYRLREEQLGPRFRRQHPQGKYVLDFACLDPKIVVELDGSQHLDQTAYAERRDAWLRGQGYCVLRFCSNDVLTDTDAVVQAIVNALNDMPRLAPTPILPQRGREQDKELA